MNKKQQPVMLLLAGGRSARFWPLSHKNFLPFLGTSLLARQATTIHNAGFDEVVIVANPDIVEPARSLGFPVIVQKGSGMAAAITSAKQRISGRSVVVVIGNDVVDASLFDRLRATITADPDGNLITTYQPDKHMPMGYVATDGGRVTKLVEKPKVGQEPSKHVTVSSHYFADADSLLDALSTVSGTRDDRYEAAINHLITHGQTFRTLDYQGGFGYLKYPWHTLVVMEYFLQTIDTSFIAKSAKIDATARIHGPVYIADGVRVMEYAKIVGPSYIGRNSIIGNHTLVRRSHIDQQCVVGFGTEITRSYVGALSWFHSNYVGDSVIGENTAMGAGSVLANLRLDETEVHSSVRSERISSQRVKFGAVIGDNVRIGVGSSIMPGIKIGRNAVIGAGVVLQEDVADNKRCFVRQSYTVKKHKHTAPGRHRGQFRDNI